MKGLIINIYKLELLQERSFLFRTGKFRHWQSSWVKNAQTFATSDCTVCNQWLQSLQPVIAKFATSDCKVCNQWLQSLQPVIAKFATSDCKVCNQGLQSLQPGIAVTFHQSPQIPHFNHSFQMFSDRIDIPPPWIPLFNIWSTSKPHSAQELYTGFLKCLFDFSILSDVNLVLFTH